MGRFEKDTVIITDNTEYMKIDYGEKEVLIVDRRDRREGYLYVQGYIKSDIYTNNIEEDAQDIIPIRVKEEEQDIRRILKEKHNSPVEFKH